MTNKKMVVSPALTSIFGILLSGQRKVSRSLSNAYKDVSLWQKYEIKIKKDSNSFKLGLCVWVCFMIAFFHGLLRIVVWEVHWMSE